MISFLLAMDKNRLIGKNNDLPWHLPADLKYFKELTMHHTIVMGRKTFESIGKPLPGRDNVVLTRDVSYHPEGVATIHSPEALLSEYDPHQEIFIIGGAKVFEAFFPYADRLYITLIEETFEGDTYFEGFHEEEWTLISEKQGTVDEKNKYKHRFLVYEKKNRLK
ncbi:dihydrofolate reductase [Scopulibacillus daqui]|uniref:Dihydrofolate reductase n=1 Tax=Scopulibacillus daqui TaxID=1469162 RepID=A0ABS2Q339_9BACL|nr:dihydrofolate reductase [Scopulibacillus daqui]MBM7646711.1 dihydrofolate reductase [Scopulibacillus daqui]